MTTFGAKRTRLATRSQTPIPQPKNPKSVRRIQYEPLLCPLRLNLKIKHPSIPSIQSKTAKLNRKKQGKSTKDGKKKACLADSGDWMGWWNKKVQRKRREDIYAWGKRKGRGKRKRKKLMVFGDWWWLSPATRDKLWGEALQLRVHVCSGISLSFWEEREMIDVSLRDMVMSVCKDGDPPHPCSDWKLQERYLSSFLSEHTNSYPLTFLNQFGYKRSHYCELFHYFLISAITASLSNSCVVLCYCVFYSSLDMASDKLDFKRAICSNPSSNDQIEEERKGRVDLAPSSSVLATDALPIPPIPATENEKDENETDTSGKKQIDIYVFMNRLSNTKEKLLKTKDQSLIGCPFCCSWIFQMVNWIRVLRSDGGSMTRRNLVFWFELDPIAETMVYGVFFWFCRPVWPRSDAWSLLFLVIFYFVVAHEWTFPLVGWYQLWFVISGCSRFLTICLVYGRYDITPVTLFEY